MCGSKMRIRPPLVGQGARHVRAGRRGRGRAGGGALGGEVGRACGPARRRRGPGPPARRPRPAAPGEHALEDGLPPGVRRRRCAAAYGPSGRGDQPGVVGAQRVLEQRDARRRRGRGRAGRAAPRASRPRRRSRYSCAGLRRPAPARVSGRAVSSSAPGRVVDGPAGAARAVAPGSGAARPQRPAGRPGNSRGDRRPGWPQPRDCASSSQAGVGRRAGQRARQVARSAGRALPFGSSRPSRAPRLGLPRRAGRPSELRADQSGAACEWRGSSTTASPW